VPGHGVSVLFKPTQARYVFEAINGSLMRGCIIDRQSADLGGYDDSQVESYARQVAATFAASILNVPTKPQDAPAPVLWGIRNHVVSR
jgi:hypothetical protein